MNAHPGDWAIIKRSAEKSNIGRIGFVLRHYCYVGDKLTFMMVFERPVILPHSAFECDRMVVDDRDITPVYSDEFVRNQEMLRREVKR